MPRGQKSKLRAQERRRQTRGDSRCLPDVQAPEGQEEESPRCSSLPGDGAPSSSDAGLPQKAEGAPPTAAVAGAPSRKRSGKGPKGSREQKATSSRATAPTESSEKILLMKKAGMLMHYVLYKYQMNETVTKGEMLRILHKRFRQRFAEILKMTSERAELLFGFDLREVKPGGGSYTLVQKLDGSSDGNPIPGLGFPMNGLLMPLLGVIFLNGNCVSEDKIWEFLNMLGIYDGKEHILFGEPRKFITKDLVQKRYLVYRQAPHRDPPRYEFLWGPRAHMETSKMKVLEFLATVNETVPSAFTLHYAEALREEEERARGKPTASRGPAARSVPGPRETSNSSTPE